MALVSATAVGVGGAAGAVARYAVGLAVEGRARDTLAVNVLGSLLFGVVLGVGVGGPLALAATVGFCGAFTTFSSHAVETARLVEDGHIGVAAGYAAATLGVALLVVSAGTAVGGLLV